MNEKTNRAEIKGGNGKVAAEDLLTTLGTGNKTYIFVNPGKNILELMMRTYFKDEDQAMAAVMLFEKCEEFNLQQGQDDLMALLAARCSVKGRSTHLALMAETGVLAPGVLVPGTRDVRTLHRKPEKEHEKPVSPA